MSHESDPPWHNAHAISTPYPGSEMVWQDHQCRNRGDNRELTDSFPHRRSTPLTFWSRLPITQGYTSFTSITYIHWRLYRHTSCHWLETPPPPAGPSMENLASIGWRRYGSTHQCLSILNPGPLVMEIATTLSRSSAAVSEWVVTLVYSYTYLQFQCPYSVFIQLFIV